MPSVTRLCPALIVLTLIASALVPTHLMACALPLDPYVVVIPDKINWPAPIGTKDVTSFTGFLPNGYGYLEIPSNVNVEWKIYWDPTNGGTKGYDPALLLVAPKVFKVRPDKPEIPLLDLSASTGALNIKDNPMKVSQIYGDNNYNGGWGANQAKPSAPYDIGGRVKGMDWMRVEMTDYDGAGGSQVGTRYGSEPSYNPNSPPPQDRWWLGMAWLEEKSTAFGPPFNPPDSQTIVIDPDTGQTFTFRGSAPSREFNVGGQKITWEVTRNLEDGSSWYGWTGGGNEGGGQYKFMDSNPAGGPNPVGEVKFDATGTGQNAEGASDNNVGSPRETQTGTGTQPATFKFTYETPSAPFFYKVQPSAIFYFRLSDNNSRWRWAERKRTYDVDSSTTPPTETLVESRTYRFEAKVNAVIKKQGTGDAPRQTYARLVDFRPPKLTMIDKDADIAGPTGGFAKNGKDYTSQGTVFVVDNNPYEAAPLSLQQAALAAGPPDANLSSYTPDNRKAYLWYSVQEDEYAGASFNGFQVPSYMATIEDPDSQQFSVYTPRFRWARSAVPLNRKSESRGVTIPEEGLAFDIGGGSIPALAIDPVELTGSGNPSFAIYAYDLATPGLFGKPFGLHLVNDGGIGNASRAIRGEDDFTAGSTAYRSKFFVEAIDGEGPARGSNTKVMGTMELEAEQAASAQRMTEPAPSFADFGYVHDGQGIVPSPYPGGSFFAAAIQVLRDRLGLSGLQSPDWANAAGNMGAISKIYDTVPPSLMVYVFDQKYDRTFVFNYPYQGEFNHPANTTGRASLSGRIASEDLPGLLQDDLIKNGVDQDARPENHTAVQVLEFLEEGSAGSTSADYVAFQDAIQNDAFRTFTNNPFRMNGLWVDEDSLLRFKVVAWDNVNYTDHSDPGLQPHGGGTPMVPRGNISWYVKDDPSNFTSRLHEGSAADARSGDLTDSLRMDDEGYFEYIFRNPNRTPVGGAGECSLTITAKDLAGNSRSYRIHFFTAASDLKITTLEERREELE